MYRVLISMGIQNSLQFFFIFFSDLQNQLILLYLSPMTNRTIPFEIPDVNHGFVEVKGLLHVKENSLVLEFDQRDV